MRGGLAAGIRLALLALTLGGGLGFQCGGGGDQTFAALLPEASTVGTFTQFTVEVLVSSPTPVQAFELGIRWDPEMLLPLGVDPHPEFDDDGVFFTTPHFHLVAGTLDRVVDVRHGGAGADGSFSVASLEFLSLDNPGPTDIELVSGGLADASGVEIPVSIVPVTITIAP
jgi:hypothetical protein